MEGRRLTALRRVADDPAADPEDDPNPVGYLATSTGRERALNIAAALGLVASVRRDWWEITDPTGTASDSDFPQGRKTERQGALALLSHLPHHGASEVTADEITTLFEEIRRDMPRWAAGYAEQLPVLARAAAAELVTAGLLRVTGDEDRWQITPGVHLWRVRARQGQPARPGRHRSEADSDPRRGRRDSHRAPGPTANRKPRHRRPDVGLERRTDRRRQMAANPSRCGELVGVDRRDAHVRRRLAGAGRAERIR
ncbi:hypothetical protein GCM10027614_21120 [Micromonospora vulcania]